MKTVRIRNVQGYNAGEEVPMPDHRALTYCRNGQAEPLGWSPDELDQQPVNRMLDTGGGGAVRTRRKKKIGSRKQTDSSESEDDQDDQE